MIDTRKRPRSHTVWTGEEPEDSDDDDCEMERMQRHSRTLQLDLLNNMNTLSRQLEIVKLYLMSVRLEQRLLLNRIEEVMNRIDGI